MATLNSIINIFPIYKTSTIFRPCLLSQKHLQLVAQAHVKQDLRRVTQNIHLTQAYSRKFHEKKKMGWKDTFLWVWEHFDIHADIFHNAHFSWIFWRSSYAQILKTFWIHPNKINRLFSKYSILETKNKKEKEFSSTGILKCSKQLWLGQCKD